MCWINCGVLTRKQQQNMRQRKNNKIKRRTIQNKTTTTGFFELFRQKRADA
jgi:hypothetical protein